MASTTNGSMLPPEYDDIHPSGYDPAFTADINTKMRIPDSLGAINNAHGHNHLLNSVAQEMTSSTERLLLSDMTVPEKIIIAGKKGVCV